MPKLVVNGAKMKCSQGTSPASLTVLPINVATGEDQQAATVQDYKPMVNIAPFGMCQTMANPQVAAATAAAQGTLTPMPCIPVTTSPWSPGSSIHTINDQAALLDSDTCNCTWTGSISISSAGQGSVDVDS
jgi:hypothetical protein